MAVTRDGIAVRKKKPAGYVDAKLFGERIGISAPSVRRALNDGKFDTKNLLLIPTPPSNKQHTLYILWEAEYVKYIKRWPKSKWPQWYLDPYKYELPKSTGPQMAALRRMADERKELEIHEERSRGKIGSGKSGSKITDMGDAVLEEKRLKVEKLQMDMDVQKNKLIDIDTAKAVMLETAQATRQGFTSLIPRIAPLLTAEDDQHKIVKILQEEFDNVLGQLSKLENYTPEGGK